MINDDNGDAYEVMTVDDLRRALHRQICGRLLMRSFDELRVVDSILTGLERGADTYGPLVISDDARDWQREADEELRDWAVYRAIGRLAIRDEKSERITAEIDAPSDVDIGGEW